MSFLYKHVHDNQCSHVTETKNVLHRSITVNGTERLLNAFYKPRTRLSVTWSVHIQRKRMRSYNSWNVCLTENLSLQLLFFMILFTLGCESSLIDYKWNIFPKIYMSHFAYACKTERQNGISRLISELLRTLDSSLRDHLFDVTEWRFLNPLIMQTC